MGKFAPFSEALQVARSLGLANQKQWWSWCASGVRPACVPSHPNRTYKGDGWQGWGHWLGTGNLGTKPFLPFDEALAVAQPLRLASQKEWQLWCQNGMRPPNVPSHPNDTYRHVGWRGWAHWLGYSGDRAGANFLPFDEARAGACSLGLTTQKEWKEWCRSGLRPPNVPGDPSKVYKNDGWRGWGHWLGTGRAPKCTRFLPFAEALAAARRPGLASRGEWRGWCKSGVCPPAVPSNPDKVYEHDGWRGWGHWLGTGSTRDADETFLPLDEALAVARLLSLADQDKHGAARGDGAQPAAAPPAGGAHAREHRHGGWPGWGTELGTGAAQPSPAFGQAPPVAPPPGLGSRAGWAAGCKDGTRPPDVPTAAPDDGPCGPGARRGWGTGLGTSRPAAQQPPPPVLTLPAARKLCVASETDGGAWCTSGARPPSVPFHPDRGYTHDVWLGCGPGFDSGRQRMRDLLPFGEALAVARSLGLHSKSQWCAWHTSGARSANVPSSPDQVYKNAGWQGWGHWLWHGKAEPREPPGRAWLAAATQPAAAGAAERADAAGNGRKRQRR